MAEVIEIGSLRERVELIEAPCSGKGARVGRIRHANGENVDVDAATLDMLVERARRAGAADASHGGCCGVLLA